MHSGAKKARISSDARNDEDWSAVESTRCYLEAAEISEGDWETIHAGLDINNENNASRDMFSSFQRD